MVALIIRIFIQVVFESLPVSSSGHLLLFKKVAEAMGYPFALKKVPEGFDFFLHTSTIVVVGVYFFSPWSTYLLDALHGCPYALQIVLCCLIADFVTYWFYCVFKTYGHIRFPLWLGFLLTATALFSTLLCTAGIRTQITLYDALVLGCVQGLALLPGVSRLGATVVAGHWLGFTWLCAGEYSLLIAWPLMTAGCLKGWWQLYSAGTGAQLLRWKIVCSMVIATSFAYVALWWVLACIAQGQVWKFGWYLLIPTLCALCF